MEGCGDCGSEFVFPASPARLVFISTIRGDGCESQQHSSKMRIRMDKTRIVSFLLAVATLLSAACSSTKVSGVWVTQDTGTGDSFYSANFVDENVGWLNGQSGREPSEDNDNANKKA